MMGVMLSDSPTRRQIFKSKGSIRRFLALFNDSHPDKCWLWKGYVDKETGYGSFYVNSDIGTIGAHRFSYKYHIGDYDENLELDHLCRIRNCINPRHLEPVTHKINMYRGLSPSIITMYTHELIRIAIGGEEPSLCLEKMLKMPK